MTLPHPRKAIQDHYPPEFAHCFGCGPANPHGLQLKSYLEGDRTLARFTPDPMYSGGYPGNVYGGMIASLLDCHGTASAAAYAHRNQGRTIGDGDPPIRFVTASLKIDFQRPTPQGVELTITGSLRSIEGRKAVIGLTLSAGDTVCAVAEMLAVQLPPRAA
ncbi:MAG TPA: PaaI family thioesterase [Burkholderiaceae bacterium]|nr:PaaI family thioesterase [Burkholderiaceae bacterium]